MRPGPDSLCITGLGPDSLYGLADPPLRSGQMEHQLLLLGLYSLAIYIGSRECGLSRPRNSGKNHLDCGRCLVAFRIVAASKLER